MGYKAQNSPALRVKNSQYISKTNVKVPLGNKPLLRMPWLPTKVMYRASHKATSALFISCRGYSGPTFDMREAHSGTAQ